MFIAHRQTAGIDRLLIALVLSTLAVTACGGTSDEPAPTAEGSAAVAPWLMRGGDINRASTMRDWSSSDQEGRLASAADLVSMSYRREGKSLPIPSEFEKLARALEAKLTAANADGSRDAEYVGAVVDEIGVSD